MVLVLRRFDLQPNIRERNPVVKRDPTVLVSYIRSLDNYIKMLVEKHK